MKEVFILKVMFTGEKGTIKKGIGVLPREEFFKTLCHVLGIEKSKYEMLSSRLMKIDLDGNLEDL